MESGRRRAKNNPANDEDLRKILHENETREVGTVVAGDVNVNTRKKRYAARLREVCGMVGDCGWYHPTCGRVIYAGRGSTRQGGNQEETEQEEHYPVHTAEGSALGIHTAQFLELRTRRPDLGADLWTYGMHKTSANE